MVLDFYEEENVFWVCECGTSNNDQTSYCLGCGIMKLEESYYNYDEDD